MSEPYNDNAGLKARESFKQEALESWAAYLRTGERLTLQDVRAWLNSWGTKEEASFASARVAGISPSKTP